MHKWFLAALAALLFAAVAYAQTFDTLPNWTSSTRFADTPGAFGFNVTTNLPEWLDTNASWHSAAPTDNPVFTGAIKTTTTVQQTTGFSAAGIVLPACSATTKGTQAWVSDATGPTYLATYVSGGSVIAPVFCNGANWVTY